jgi:glycosyltransferase involved in cell wall biosynthesis
MAGTLVQGSVKSMPSRDQLRLLHVIHMLNPIAGGAVSAARSMCAALAARGHDVVLYATEVKGWQEEQGNSYRTRVFTMEFSPLAVSAGFVRALDLLKNIDLVHIHQLYRFPQSAAAHFCRRHSIPYCIQPHGSLAPELFHKRERRITKRIYEMLIENRNLHHAAGLVYTAEGERDEVDFLHLAPPAFIVPNGLRLAEFDGSASGFRAEHGLAGKELIAWMGRLVPVKGLDILLKAFAPIARQRPHAVLALIGPDPENYGVVLRQMIDELGIAAGQIIFTGMLRDREKLAALAEADLFVMPSYTENFALATVEAMAMGRPVIVSKGVKIAPAIARAGAGLVVAPNADELGAAMTDLLGNEAARRRMGSAARILAASYDWRSVVVKLEDAYRAMITGSAR